MIFQPFLEIITVGDELLAESSHDTNSDHIAGWALKNGLIIKFRTVVGDQPDNLENAVKTAIHRVNIIVITGGLGPTWDDVTRQAIAKSIDKELRLHKGAEDSMMKAYQARSIQPDSQEMVQAWLPEGSEHLNNPVGLAPGIFYKGVNFSILAFPGVPAEMRAMLESFPIKDLLSMPFDPMFETKKTIRIIKGSQ